MQCPRCQQTHQRCAGHRKSDGMPCRSFPVEGADKCRMHVGRKAALVKQQARAAKAVVTLGLPVDVDPHDALLEEVRRTAGHVRWLGQVVHEIEEGDLVWGTTRVKSGGDDRGITQEAGPNVWLTLYQAERKHLVAVCKTAIGAGIDERRVQIEEQQGELFAQAQRAILFDLGVELTPDVVETVGRHLRAIDGGRSA